MDSSPSAIVCDGAPRSFNEATDGCKSSVSFGHEPPLRARNASPPLTRATRYAHQRVHFFRSLESQPQGGLCEEGVADDFGNITTEAAPLQRKRSDAGELYHHRSLHGDQDPMCPANDVTLDLPAKQFFHESNPESRSTMCVHPVVVQSLNLRERAPAPPVSWSAHAAHDGGGPFFPLDKRSLVGFPAHQFMLSPRRSNSAVSPPECHGGGGECDSLRTNASPPVLSPALTTSSSPHMMQSPGFDRRNDRCAQYDPIPPAPPRDSCLTACFPEAELRPVASSEQFILYDEC